MPNSGVHIIIAYSVTCNKSRYKDPSLYSGQDTENSMKKCLYFAYLAQPSKVQGEPFGSTAVLI